MSVTSISIKIYTCKCDICGKYVDVKESKTIYNGAQAVRSLKWSYGKDKSVKCDKCRRNQWNDHYQYR